MVCKFRLFKWERVFSFSDGLKIRTKSEMVCKDFLSFSGRLRMEGNGPCVDRRSHRRRPDQMNRELHQSLLKLGHHLPPCNHTVQSFTDFLSPFHERKHFQTLSLWTFDHDDFEIGRNKSCKVPVPFVGRSRNFFTPKFTLRRPNFGLHVD